MSKYINWPRLAAGSAVLVALLVPAYVFLPREDAAGSVAPAALVQTPPAAGRSVSVGVAEGKLAPDFEVSLPDARRLRLSELRGRPVLINFWATWCGSCLSEMPEIKALQERRGLDAFTVLAMNAGEAPSRAAEFIDFLGAPFLYGLDVDMRVTDAYGVYGLPLSVFVDSTGVIQAVYRGHADRMLLERFVDAAIGAQPPGEVAPVIRIVSTIPRERVLTVRVEGSQLILTSRSLRCDPAYCATAVIEALRRTTGISSVKVSAAAGDTKLTVRFDQGTRTADAVVEALLRELGSRPDPLYDGPLQVRWEGR